jgi:transcriptional regulator with XRE-family HTH domain
MGKLRDAIKAELMTGTSQVRLAKNIGVSPGTIYKLLYTDSVPKIETLRLVAKYFDVSPSTFASDFIPFELATPDPPPALPTPPATTDKPQGDIVSVFLETIM